MNEKFKYIFILFLFSKTVFSQGGTFNWARPVGNDNEILFPAIVANNALGDVYVCGVFQNTVDFDTGPSSYTLNATSGNVFIMKLTSAGNLLWAKNFGNAAVRAFTVDASGNMYIAGYFQNTCDFEPGIGTTNLTATGNPNGYISKLDTDGNLLWAKMIAGNNDNYLLSVNFDQSGNVYYAGSFSGGVDVDPGPGSTSVTSIGSSDVLIGKLNSQGSFVWGFGLGGTGFDRASIIKLNDVNNCYVVGDFSGVVDFNPGIGTSTLSASTGNNFLLKLDANGNYTWAKNSEGTIKTIATGIDGSPIAGGTFGGTIDIDPTPNTYTLTTQSLADAFILKLNNSGDFEWAKIFQSLNQVNYPVHINIQIDASGNIYSFGSFAGVTDFDTGPSVFTFTASGVNDSYVAKLNNVGDLIWARSLQSTAGDSPISLSVDQNNDIYVTGFFVGLIDLDPGPGTYTFYIADQTFNSASYLLKLGGGDVGLNEYNYPTDTPFIYPIPFIDKIFFSGLTNSDPIDFKIFDFAGRELVSRLNFEHTIGFNLPELLPGIYFGIIKYHNSQYSFKIVKN